MDGTGGRSSFSGLQECLANVLEVVCQSLNQFIIPDNYPLPADLCKKEIDKTYRSIVLRGVWIPISNLLLEKFSGMFSAGNLFISNEYIVIFVLISWHDCYRYDCYYGYNVMLVLKGIASTMARCYRAVDWFIQQLGNIIGER